MTLGGCLINADGKGYGAGVGARIVSQLNRVALFNVLIKQLTFDKPFAADPEDEGTVFIVGELSDLVDADAGVGGGFFNCQVGFSQMGTSFMAILLSRGGGYTL